LKNLTSRSFSSSTAHRWDNKQFFNVFFFLLWLTPALVGASRISTRNWAMFVSRPLLHDIEVWAKKVNLGGIQLRSQTSFNYKKFYFPGDLQPRDGGLGFQVYSCGIKFLLGHFGDNMGCMGHVGVFSGIEEGLRILE